MSQPAQALDAAALAAWPLPMPPADGDKDARGSLLVVAGCAEMPGAAILAATAALRVGGGKLKIATARSVAAVVAAAVPESRVVAFDETPTGGPASHAAQQLAPLLDGCHAVLVGPGMQDTASVVALVTRLLPALQQAGCTLVLDACAMHAVGALRGAGLSVVLTPHAGEMAGLTGINKAAVQADPAAIALRYASQWQAGVLLKGATTWLAAPDGRLWRHGGGTVGLATSGSGDTLAGMVCGLAARGANAEQAAAWGCVLHALAGERLAEAHGPLGYLAREIPHTLPAILHTLSKQ